MLNLHILLPDTLNITKPQFKYIYHFFSVNFVYSMSFVQPKKNTVYIKFVPTKYLHSPYNVGGFGEKSHNEGNFSNTKILQWYKNTNNCGR